MLNNLYSSSPELSFLIYFYHNFTKSHLAAALSVQTVMTIGASSRTSFARSSVVCSRVPRHNPAAMLYNGVSIYWYKQINKGFNGYEQSTMLRHRGVSILEVHPFLCILKVSVSVGSFREILNRASLTALVQIYRQLTTSTMRKLKQ